MKQQYQDILDGNSTCSDWLSAVEQNNTITANNYRNHLRKLGWFVRDRYNLTLDQFLAKIIKNQQKAPQDAEPSLLPHNVLSKFLSYINTELDISQSHKRMLIVTAKQYLLWNDVEISESKMQAKVKLPKVVKKKKTPLSVQSIREIILASGDIRLRTYIHFLAATGCRATEGLSIRICDLELDAIPPRANIRGEFTKTKVDRFVYLTKELAQVLRDWLDYKYRERRTIIKKDGRMESSKATPLRQKNDLVFSQAHFSEMDVDPHTLYYQFSRKYGELLDRIELGDLEDNKQRRKLTLHSFRRFVKTTIANLGYSDYSEWFIGHAGSTYWTSPDKEKAATFVKIEPYLTFLNYSELEAIGSDVQTKIQEKDKQIMELSEQLRKNNEIQVAMIKLDIDKLYQQKKKRLERDGKTDQITSDQLDDEKYQKVEECKNDVVKLFNLKTALEKELEI